MSRNSEQVKYPAQPTYTATVANEEVLIPSKQDNCGAKFLLSVGSLIFTILGFAMATLAVYTIVVTTYGGINLLTGYSSGAVYTLLVVGLVLFLLSIVVWISTCHPNHICAKIILTLFSIAMLAFFLIEVVLTIIGSFWLYHVNLGLYNVTADAIFNDTVAEVYQTCCIVTANTTQDTQLLCDDLFGTNATRALDCTTYNTLYAAILTIITPVFKWALVFLGVVGLLNLLAFACSCCLICAKSRNRAFYKPAVTYANGV